jgi:hypothetical protein
MTLDNNCDCCSFIKRPSTMKRRSDRSLAYTLQVLGATVSLFCLSLPLLKASRTAAAPIVQAAATRQTQNPKPQVSSSSPRRRIVFRLPNRGGAPGSREWGGTRNPSCISSNNRLTALLPTTNLGHTLSTHPTLFWYVPSTKAETAEFILQDSTYQDIYTTTMPLTQTGGIMSFTLPQHIKPLEINQQYHWYFTIVCDPDEPSANPTVEGWVQRVEPPSPLQTSLNQSSSEAQSAIYAENGIWFEALASLTELRRSRPQDRNITQDWNDLLSSVSLKPFLSTEPLLACCVKMQ